MRLGVGFKLEGFGGFLNLHYCFGVPIIRLVVFWVHIGLPLFGEIKFHEAYRVSVHGLGRGELRSDISRGTEKASEIRMGNSSCARHHTTTSPALPQASKPAELHSPKLTWKPK